MKHGDDNRDVLSTNAIRRVRKMVQQRTSYTVSNFRELIGKLADSIDSPCKLLHESKPKALVVVCIPCFGLLDIGFCTVPDNIGITASRARS